MPSKRPLKGLLIDFDDTLVPEYDVANEVVTNLCKEVSSISGVDTAKVRSMFLSIAEAILPQTPAGAAAAEFFGGSIGFPAYAHELLWDHKSPIETLAAHMGAYRAEVWRSTLKSLGVTGDGLAGTLADRLPNETSAMRVPYPEAEAVLRDLAKRFRMAIVTNGEPEVQAMKVERSGLRGHFDHVVLCSNYRPKPDPMPFNVALELLDCTPDQVAMVGNSLHSDIAGAQKLGIYSVWINRAGRRDGTDIVPDVVIKDLSQLLDVL